MPPHCDSLDGPVVVAARQALSESRVEVVLPFVHAEGDPEVREAFASVVPIHAAGGKPAEIADTYFFETVVRVHREGEGAPYRGLKPAGLDVGPVIPLAEAAVESGDPEPLADFLASQVRKEVHRRLRHLHQLDIARDGSLERERAYVEAMLGFEVYSHHLFLAMSEDHSG